MGKFISVPKNMEAMYHGEYGQWDDDEHYIWHLSEEDHNLLWKCGVFDLLNDVFGTLIDEYEEEEIFYQKLFFRKSELYEQFASFACSQQMDKLKDMIEKAIATKTLISFVL